MASSKGVSHGRVIVDCERSLRQYTSLEKVVPALVDKKVLPKKLGKGLVKKNDDHAKGLFVDYLKTLTLEQFGVFLTVIRSIEEEEAKERPMMKLLSSSMKSMQLKPGSDIQALISDFIKAADSSKKSSHRQSPTSIGSTTNIDEASVNAIQSTAVQSISVSSTTDTASNAVDTNETQVSIQSVHNGNETRVSIQSTHSVSSDVEEAPLAAASSAKFPFPSGFMSGCKSRSFTREGGMLYSPEHGVTVIIPESAVPSSIENFVLGIYVYMDGPFTLPQNVQPCSPIVWFYHHPQFVFEADVIVKIPHSAAVQPQFSDPSVLLTKEPLCVLTVQEGQDEGASQFALTRCLKADFSDGYHAVFAVRHFSPHGVVRNKEQQSSSRSRLGSNESAGVRLRTRDKSSSGCCIPCRGQTTKELQKSGSLPDKENELYQLAQGETKKQNEANQKFCIARCMPTDRSSTKWTVDFIVFHFHPSGTHVSLMLD